VSHQNTASRLEARGPAPASPEPLLLRLRREAERAGSRLIALVRELAAKPGGREGTMPAPAGLFYELGRADRVVTVSSWLAAIAALARDPRITDAQLYELVIEFEAWIVSLRPYTRRSTRDHFEADALQQAEADVAQARVLMARELGDRCAIDRCRKELREHVAVSKGFLVHLNQMERELAA
jgi:hypothetical protein